MEKEIQAKREINDHVWFMFKDLWKCINDLERTDPNSEEFESLYSAYYIHLEEVQMALDYFNSINQMCEREQSDIKRKEMLTGNIP